VSGNCYKARLLLAHLGVDYERREIDVIDRSGHSDLLGEVNPTLQVPTLVLDDGRPLAESNAILWYLGLGTRYLPDDDFDRAKVLQWMFFEQYSHEPNIAVVRYWVSIASRCVGERTRRRRCMPFSKAGKQHDAGHRWSAPVGHSPSPAGAVSGGDGIIEPCLRTACGDAVSLRTC
jgi:glutathione S-transferase